MDIPQLQNRPVIAHTPMPEVLHFKSMKGQAGLSELFEFNVELVAKTYMLDVRSLLGKPLTLQVETASGAPHYLNGQIIRFELVGRELLNSEYYVYRATVRPSLWYLTQSRDNRIFQNKSVVDILKQVLGAYSFPVEYNLTESYRNWEYCVQYQESDFDFVSRLMEHEGIYYWFRHENGEHTLVLTDDMSTHEPAPGHDTYTFYDGQMHMLAHEEFVSDWHVQAQITPGGYATVDYDFRKPSARLDSTSKNAETANTDKLEIYEWQGGYQEADHGEKYARLRLQEIQGAREQVLGICNIRAVEPGRNFKLRNHPRRTENREYLCVSASYNMSVAGYSTGTEQEDHFEVIFRALPSNIQFRAPRVTPQPKTSGPQTARVVGPAGEELWTDQYGRIKVMFHWDRQATGDENSSCWIRVSSPWAGGGFGGLQLPRINDEVVVDFIGGNPDRPVILGRVYNAQNMPPVSLPANATQSGFRSQSVFGDPSMRNQMIFEDKLGQELVDMRAQLDMVLNVVRNLTVTVGANLKTTVGETETRDVTGTRTTHIVGHEKETFDAGVHRDITASGLTDHIKGGATTKIITGNNVFRVEEGTNTVYVKSNEHHTIDGTLHQDVKEAATLHYKNKLTRTVAETEDVTVTGAATHTYENTFTSKHGGKVLFDATKQDFEILCKKYTITASSGEIKNVTSHAVNNYKAGRDTTVSGIDYKAVTILGYDVMPIKVSVTWAVNFGYSSLAIQVQPLRVALRGIAMQLDGLNLALTGLKFSNQAVKVDVSGASWKADGIDLKTTAAKTTLQGLGVTLAGLKLFA
ncbi:type VI secretion system Vgr family protein [Advenella mimigardefordensis]|nr:type VI secretion system tip protein TssI/VgrG [Advenella mimigardefordensis]